MKYIRVVLFAIYAIFLVEVAESKVVIDEIQASKFNMILILIWISIDLSPAVCPSRFTLLKSFLSGNWYSDAKMVNGKLIAYCDMTGVFYTSNYHHEMDCINCLRSKYPPFKDAYDAGRTRGRKSDIY